MIELLNKRQKPLLLERFHPFDRAFCSVIRKAYPTLSDNVDEALCYLAAARRAGHVCVEVSSKLVPDPQDLWLKEELQCSMDMLLLESQMKALSQSIINGFEKINVWLEKEFASAKANSPFIKWNERFYLNRAWQEETHVLTHVQRLLKQAPFHKLDKKRIQESLENLLKEKKLSPEQVVAIQQSLDESFAIISGGPGTGKTHVAGLLIYCLWNALEEDVKKDFEIALTAPTGKAAAQLQKSLQRVMKQLTGLNPPSAQTLHRFLQLRSSSQAEEEQRQQLSADLILVDESSMLDAKLFSELLVRIKPGARLILLGDPQQLPPVETASFFEDLVNILQKYGKGYTELKTCLRAELQSISAFADHLKQGKSAEAFQLMESESENAVHYHILNPTKKGEAERWIENMSHFCHIQIGAPSPTLEALEKFRRFCLLSPIRKGKWGSQDLNQKLAWKKMSQHKGHTVLSLPIMIIKNDNDLDVFNGDMGVLVKHLNVDKEGVMRDEFVLSKNDYALFPSRELNASEEVRRIPALVLPSFEYAYCLTVHKSQGSEFQHVALVLPNGSERLGRQMLYTAATRARRQLDIWSEERVFELTVKKRQIRLSGLFPRFFQEKEKDS